MSCCVIRKCKWWCEERQVWIWTDAAFSTVVVSAIVLLGFWHWSERQFLFLLVVVLIELYVINTPPLSLFHWPHSVFIFQIITCTIHIIVHINYTTNHSILRKKNLIIISYFFKFVLFLIWSIHVRSNFRYWTVRYDSTLFIYK